MKILVTTDFSEASDNAIRYASKLAHFLDEDRTNFLLLHSFKPMVPYTNVPSTPVMKTAQLEDELLDKFEKQHVRLQHHHPTTAYFKQGALPDSVMEVIDQEQPSLIVMGNREKTTMGRMTLGSNTVEVMVNSLVPLLAVPAEASFRQMKEVVIATDLEPPNISDTSLQLLKKWITKSPVNVTVLHVFKKGKAEVLQEKLLHTELDRVLSDIPHINYPAMNRHVFDGISDYLEEHQPDLLVAMPRDHGFFERIFKKSVTEELIYETQTPLLVLTP